MATMPRQAKTSKAETLVKAPFSSGKVAPARSAAEDREFEHLLQRAADLMKNHRAAAREPVSDSVNLPRPDLDSES